MPPHDAHFALVVGINKYPALTSLRGPRNDAREVFKWLSADDGGELPRSNIEHLEIDDTSFETAETAEPTRKLINNALGRLIEKGRAFRKSRPTEWQKSRLYVYVSGHGIAPNAREVALLTADVQPNVLGESIPCAVYMAHLQDSQFFRELVFFADCCRTSKVQAQLAGPPFNVEQGNMGQVSTVLGFATGFGDLAYEPTEEEEKDPDLTRGYFTKAVLEALRGEAIDREMGQVDTTNLAKYVRERVLDLTASRPAPQEPIIMADPARPVVFRPVAKRPKKTVVFQFAEGLVGEAALYDGGDYADDGSLKQLHQHQCNGEDWTLSLPNGSYALAVHGTLAGAQFEEEQLFRVLGGDKHVLVPKQ